MALAEFWFGTGKSYKNIISIIAGRGVGSGIIVNGQLLRGTSNYTGEWGHTIIKKDEKDNFLTIEKIINQSLNNFWIKKGNQENINSIDPITELNAVKAFADSGDSDAQEAVEEISNVLGIGISNLINLFNPEVIILGGWLGVILQNNILPKITTFIKTVLPLPYVDAVKICTSRFGYGESCIGGGSLVINSYLGYNI